VVHPIEVDVHPAFGPSASVGLAIGSSPSMILNFLGIRVLEAC
jgi:hypothetical protein